MALDGIRILRIQAKVNFQLLCWCSRPDRVHGLVLCRAALELLWNNLSSFGLPTKGSCLRVLLLRVCLMTFVNLISSNSAGGRINNSMDLFLINKDTQLLNVLVEN